jgi:hypothetical protein
MAGPRYRLSTLFAAMLLIALILGFYSFRRDGNRKAWTGADGVWRLDEMVVDAETLDLPESLLRIRGLEVDYVFGDQLASGTVTPTFNGIDFAYPDGFTARALFDAQDGKLRICHTRDGVVRPTKIPDQPAELADCVLMTFVRDDSLDW